MQALVIANQKGGVGKSAVATQLAHYLYRRGLAVAVLDLDHQQNTSRALKGAKDLIVAAITASQIFEGRSSFEQPTGRFVLVSGDDRLSDLERMGECHNAFANRYRAALNAWSAFDVVIVDTNPNPDIRYASALISADFVLAPVQLNQEAIAGISALMMHPRYGVQRIQGTLNPSLKFLGILPNLVEPTPFQKANFERLAARYGGLLLSAPGEGGQRFGCIPKRSIIAEAQAAHAFVPDMPKTSARDTWRELKPVFDMVVANMNLPMEIIA